MTIRVIVVAVLAAASGFLVTFLVTPDSPSSNVLVERVLESVIYAPEVAAPVALPQRNESIVAQRAAARQTFVACAV